MVYGDKEKHLPPLRFVSISDLRSFVHGYGRKVRGQVVVETKLLTKHVDRETFLEC